MAIVDKEEGHDSDLGYNRKELKVRKYNHKDKTQNKHQVVDGLKNGDKVMKMFVRGNMKDSQLVSNLFIRDLTDHR